MRNRRRGEGGEKSRRGEGRESERENSRAVEGQRGREGKGM